MVANIQRVANKTKTNPLVSTVALITGQGLTHWTRVYIQGRIKS